MIDKVELMGHLMVDIETLGTKSKSVILSIGALEFDIETGKTGRKFYTNISLDSCIGAGLRIDGKTVMWWFDQGQEARQALSHPEPIPLKYALNDFRVFIKSLDVDIQVWGNSARFDLGILNDAYDTFNEDIPWNFRNERDVRTLVSFRPDIKKMTPFYGTAHNALDDCDQQVRYCSAIWKSVKMD